MSEIKDRLLQALDDARAEAVASSEELETLITQIDQMKATLQGTVAAPTANDAAASG